MFYMSCDYFIFYSLYSECIYIFLYYILYIFICLFSKFVLFILVYIFYMYSVEVVYLLVAVSDKSPGFCKCLRFSKFGFAIFLNSAGFQT